MILEIAFFRLSKSVKSNFFGNRSATSVIDWVFYKPVFTIFCILVAAESSKHDSTESVNNNAVSV